MDNFYSVGCSIQCTKHPNEILRNKIETIDYHIFTIISTYRRCRRLLIHTPLSRTPRLSPQTVCGSTHVGRTPSRHSGYPRPPSPSPRHQRNLPAIAICHLKIKICSIYCAFKSLSEMQTFFRDDHHIILYIVFSFLSS